jgi:ribosomal protein L30E
MAKKKETGEDIKTIKEKLVVKKIVIGTDTVIKKLQLGELEKIYLTNNCPGDVKESITHYSDLAHIPVVNLELDNEELGVLCKKNFFISVLGVLQ